MTAKRKRVHHSTPRKGTSGLTKLASEHCSATSLQSRQKSKLVQDKASEQPQQLNSSGGDDRSQRFNLGKVLRSVRRFSIQALLSADEAPKTTPGSDAAAMAATSEENRAGDEATQRRDEVKPAAPSQQEHARKAQKKANDSEKSLAQDSLIVMMSEVGLLDREILKSSDRAQPVKQAVIRKKATGNDEQSRRTQAAVPNVEMPRIGKQVEKPKTPNHNVQNSNTQLQEHSKRGAGESTKIDTEISSFISSTLQGFIDDNETSEIVTRGDDNSPEQGSDKKIKPSKTRNRKQKTKVSRRSSLQKNLLWKSSKDAKHPDRRQCRQIKGMVLKTAERSAARKKQNEEQFEKIDFTEFATAVRRFPVSTKVRCSLETGPAWGCLNSSKSHVYDANTQNVDSGVLRRQHPIESEALDSTSKSNYNVIQLPICGFDRRNSDSSFVSASAAKPPISGTKQKSSQISSMKRGKGGSSSTAKSRTGNRSPIPGKQAGRGYAPMVAPSGGSTGTSQPYSTMKFQASGFTSSTGRSLMSALEAEETPLMTSVMTGATTKSPNSGFMADSTKTGKRFSITSLKATSSAKTDLGAGEKYSTGFTTSTSQSQNLGVGAGEKYSGLGFISGSSLRSGSGTIGNEAEEKYSGSARKSQNSGFESKEKFLGSSNISGSIGMPHGSGFEVGSQKKSQDSSLRPDEHFSGSVRKSENSGFESGEKFLGSGNISGSKGMPHGSGFEVGSQKKSQDSSLRPEEHFSGSGLIPGSPQKSHISGSQTKEKYSELAEMSQMSGMQTPEKISSIHKFEATAKSIMSGLKVGKGHSASSITSASQARSRISGFEPEEMPSASSNTTSGTAGISYSSVKSKKKQSGPIERRDVKDFLLQAQPKQNKLVKSHTPPSHSRVTQNINRGGGESEPLPQVPSYFPKEHSATKMALETLSSPKDLSMMRMYHGPTLFHSAYYEIPDQPSMGLPAFHRKANLILNAQGICVYNGWLHMLERIVKSHKQGSCIIKITEPCFVTRLRDYSGIGDVEVIPCCCLIIRRAQFRMLTHFMERGWSPHHPVRVLYRRPFNINDVYFEDSIDYFLEVLGERPSLNLKAYLQTLIYAKNTQLNVHSYRVVERKLPNSGDIIDDNVSIPRRLLRHLARQSTMNQAVNILTSVELFIETTMFDGSDPYSNHITASNDRFKSLIDGVKRRDEEACRTYDQDCCIALVLSVAENLLNHAYKRKRNTIDISLRLTIRLLIQTKWLKAFYTTNPKITADYFTNIGESMNINKSAVENVNTAMHLFLPYQEIDIDMADKEVVDFVASFKNDKEHIPDWMKRTEEEELDD